MKINSAVVEAYRVLEGEELSFELALELMKLEGEDILDLLSLARKVKKRFAQEESHVCTIMNAKSGVCSENCRFCAQSGHYATGIEVYPLLPVSEMVAKARETYEKGVRTFGLVTSGHGFRERNGDFELLLEGIRAIRREFPDLSVCASLGMLSEETAAALAEEGVVHYNINFQTNPQRYAELIATTHHIDEKLETMRLLQKHGIKLCAGGILGLGEAIEDRVKLFFAAKEMGVEVIPLNVLIPIAKTPLEDLQPLSASEVVKSFAVCRLVNPTKTIKFAAGRETRMKDFQALIMLAGANGLLTGGYLTTRGRESEEDFNLLAQLNNF